MTSMYALVHGDRAIKPVSQRWIVGAAKDYFYEKIGYKEIAFGFEVVSNSGVSFEINLQASRSWTCTESSASISSSISESPVHRMHWIFWSRRHSIHCHNLRVTKLSLPIHVQRKLQSTGEAQRCYSKGHVYMGHEGHERYLKITPLQGAIDRSSLHAADEEHDPIY